MGNGRSKYILGERIAQGGMAEIYLGKIVGAEGFTRLCAFKKVLPHFTADQEFMEMFRNEAMVAKQLQNKNIVQVYDFESDPVQGSMLVMEFVDGQDLRSILREVEKARKRIPVELAVYIAAEVLNGLGFAHASVDMSGKSLGIIHRDVSPQNVLVSFEGDVKITDFGIAKVQSAASNTRAGVLKGKFRYMAPEQAKGESIDARSDIFALGIVLYEMLTMARLFKGDDDFQILQAVRDCNVRSPNEVNGVSIPPELESIALKLLARNPAERYQTARDAVKDLTRFLYSYRKDFFPGELSEFMQQIFADKLSSARDKMRSTLALPVDAVFMAPNLSQQNGNLDSRPLAGSIEGRDFSDVLVESSKHSAQPKQSLNANRFDHPPAVPPLPEVQVQLATSGANGAAIELNHQGTRKTLNQRTVGAIKAERDFRAQRVAIPEKKKGFEKIFFLIALVFSVVFFVLFLALKQRVLKISSVIEIKSAVSSQKRVKIRINGTAFKGGAWVDLPLKLQVDAGQQVIVVSKPGFKDQRIVFQAPLIGNTLWGGPQTETVLLGKESNLANLIILTDPVGAKIIVDDGQFVGTSGRQIEFVPVGRRYKVRIEHPRCSPQVGEVELPASAANALYTKQYKLKNCR